MDKRALTRWGIGSLCVLAVAFAVYWMVFVFAKPQIIGPPIRHNGTDNFYYDGEDVYFEHIGVQWDPNPGSEGNLTVNCSALGGPGMSPPAINETPIQSPGFITNFTAKCPINYSNIPPPLTNGGPFAPISGGNITFIARNSSGGLSGPPPDILSGTIVAYNFTVPLMGPGPMRFGPLTTNLANVSDFSNVNYIIDIQINGTNVSAPWNDFQTVALYNFSSLNMTNPNINLGQLFQALAPPGGIDVHINPNSLNTSSIFLNSTALLVFNTSTTLTLYYLPFKTMPNVTTSDGSINNSFSMTYVFSNASGGNLTFKVNSFSTYYILDNMAPIISLISPANNSVQTSSTVLLNVTLNGTSSDINQTQSYINITGPVLSNFLVSTMTCVNLTADSDTIQCNSTLAGLSNGQYNISITARDSGNNSGNVATYDGRFTVAIPGPITVTINAPTNNQYLNNSLININLTVTNSSAAMNFTNITIYNSTNALVNNTNDTRSGNYVVGLTVPADGVFSIFANASDVNGNSSLANVTVTVDTIAPDLAINSPANGTWTSATSFVPNFNFSDANGAGYCKEYYGIYLQSSGAVINGSGTLLPGGAIPSPYINNGSFTWYIWCNDTAGNVNISEVRTLYSDTAAPNATLISPANGTYANVSAQNFTANLTDNLGLKNVTLNIYNSSNVLVNQTTTIFGAGVTNIVIGTVVTLLDGVYKWFYSLFDFAGNSYTTTNNTVTIDTITPGIDFGAGTDGPGGYVSKSNITINLTFSDANLMTMILKVYNTSTQVDGSSTTFPTGSNTWNLPSTGSWADGIYFFNATVTDPAGNFNKTVTRNVTLDTVAPSITLNYPGNNSYNNTGVQFNWTVTDATSPVMNCTFRIGTVVENYLVSSGASQVSTAVSFGSDGVYYWNVTCFDLANNTQTSATRTYTWDATNPGITYSGTTDASGLLVSRTSVNAGIVISDTNNMDFYIRLYNSSRTNIITYSGTDQGAGTYTALTFGSLSDGLYFFNATVNDLAGNSNTTATRNVTLDTTAPAISYGNGAEADGSNYTRTNIVINATASDANGIANLTVNLYNSTGLVNSTVRASSPNYVNVTSLGDGVYYINATATDNAGNVNMTAVRRVAIDTTAPVLTLTQSAVAKDSMTIGISAVDTTGLNGTCNSSRGTVSGTTSISESGLSCSTPYTYEVYCWDYTGNSGNATGTFTTTSCGVGEPAVGGGAAAAGAGAYLWDNTFVPDNEKLLSGEEYRKAMPVKNRIRFYINKLEHYIGVLEVSEKTVKIVVASAPQETTMTIGETKKFEITGDNYYDVQVTLNAISGGNADLTVKYIQEKVPVSEAVAAPAAGEGAAPSAGAEAEKAKTNTAMIITAIIVIVLAIAVIYYVKRRR